MEEKENSVEPTTAPEINPSGTSNEAVPTPVETHKKAIPIVADSEEEPAPVESAETPPELPGGASPTKQEFTPPKPPGHKKRWLIILVVVILLAAGVAAWMIMGKKKDSSTSSSSSGSNAQSQTAPANTYTPVSVAYAYKDTDTNPFILYTRPVAGGNRTAADLKLNASENVISKDVIGTNIAFNTDKGIYVSTDSGKSYRQVYQIKNNAIISGLKLSSDSSNIVFGYLASAQESKAVIKTTDLNGQNSKDIFSTDKPGVEILAYSKNKQMIIYSQGCINCDGYDVHPLLRDLKTNKTTNLLSGVNVEEIGSMSVNIDLTKLIYAKSTINKSYSGPALGGFTAAPYDINLVDLASNKTSKIATFGTKDEKNANGTLKTRMVHVGFVAGSSTPFYTDDGKVYEVKSGSPSLIYQATKPIIYIPFVGDNNVIAGSGTQTADYTLVNYDITAKKSTNIFSGDNNTVILGVTTK